MRYAIKLAMSGQGGEVSRLDAVVHHSREQCDNVHVLSWEETLRR